VTDNRREAGPEQGSGPAREQVVTKDKRKIDMSGQPKPEAEQADGATQADDDARPNMGQPPKSGEAGTGSAETAAADNGAAKATPVEQVAGEATPSKGFGAELEAMRSELDERLRDLQRITAEYANYRKRVERDRGLMAEQTVAMVVGALLPILDDFDRARDHGDLVGQLATMAEQLSAALAKFGLTGFGEQGDKFDPTRHEAVAHQTSAEVAEPTCIGIMRRGYLLGEKLLRPALVAVADPE
jgi:molecular chaperone GrpE